jgi:tetratricopeptide (TPR) repeat protein
MRKAADKVYQFGPFQLVGSERQLLREGTAVPLTLKAFDLLLALVQHAFRILDKEDLMRTLWPNTTVEESNLTVTICMLRKALKDAFTLSSELRDSFMVLFCLYFLALTKANQGQLSTALAGLAEVRAMAHRNEEHYQLLKIPNSLAWIYRELGALDRALEQDRIGIELSRQHAVLEAEANSTINLGLDYLSNQEVHKTTDILRQAEALLQRDDWFRWRFGIRLQAARCKQALAQQDTTRAEQEGRLLLQTAARYRAREYSSVAHRLLAQAAMDQKDLDLAQTHLDAAQTMIRKYPAPLEAWKVHAARARLSTARGLSRQARKSYADAFAVIQEIAAHVNEEDLRSTFLNSPPVRAILTQTIRTA